MIIYMSYHHYSPALSGGLRAAEEGTCDASESEVVRTQVQRAPTSFSVKSALRPDPSTSSSTSNFGKCDTTATRVEQDPQQASLVSYPVFMPKPSTHHMHDPGSIVPYIRPKVITDNQMSQIKYNYYINNVSMDYDDSQ
jgi:hypothetical protein